MNVDEVLTNEFFIHFDESSERLLVYRVKDGVKLDFPVELRLSTLIEMGSAGASKWVGETLLLLVPTVREKLFHIDKPKE